MHITFINNWQAIFTAFALVCAVVIYFTWVRPHIADKPAFIAARGTVIAWLKVRWDMVTAAVIAAAPIVWNGLMDTIVAISLGLADVLPTLSGMDLSKLLISDSVKAWVPVLAVIVPAIRAVAVKRKAENP